MTGKKRKNNYDDNDNHKENQILPNKSAKNRKKCFFMHIA